MTSTPTARWMEAARPTTPLGRLTVLQGMHAAGEALFAVSLAGSLFFAVSLDAARPRIILYLLLTMAPFAVVAPLLGPLTDRLRGGHRMVLVLACLGRAGACWLLAGHLRELLLYPEAFAVLVLGKTYSVSKNALVPTLVEGDEELVRANARLTLVSLAGGAVGGGVGSGLVAVLGAPWALRIGAVVFVVAAAQGVRLPRVRAQASTSAVVDYEAIHTPVVQLGAWAMALLRGSVGFLLFLLGFALRRAGEPAWVYGLVFAASGAGSLLGSLLAPVARRRIDEERMLAGALAVPAAIAVAGAVWFGRLSILLVPLAVGVAAAAGKQAFDALVQKHSPAASRGRAFARFETVFQLAWVVGALLPVVSDAGARVGFALLGSLLVIGTVAQVVWGRAAFQIDEGLQVLRSRLLEDPTDLAREDLPGEVLAAAARLAEVGSPRWAVIEAVAALELVVAGWVPPDASATLDDRLGEPLRNAVGWSPADEPELWTRWQRVVALRDAVGGPATVSRVQAAEAVSTVQAISARLRGGV